jgi:hypothetical protein
LGDGQGDERAAEFRLTALTFDRAELRNAVDRRMNTNANVCIEEK